MKKSWNRFLAVIERLSDVPKVIFITELITGSDSPKNGSEEKL